VGRRSRASGAAHASHVWNAFRRDGAGRDALPRDPRQDVRWLISGAAPLIACAFRRVRRRTSTDAFQTCDAGRAGVHLPSETLHRTSPADVLPRIARERVPTIGSAPPNQIVKPRGPFAETLSIRPRSGSNPRLPVPLTVILDKG